MINPNLPMELDDGTFVTLDELQPDNVRVKFFGQPFRKPNERKRNVACWYNLATGIYLGSDRTTYKVLRNVLNEADFIEDF